MYELLLELHALTQAAHSYVLLMYTMMMLHKVNERTVGTSGLSIILWMFTVEECP